MRIVGNKMYAVCAGCGKIVQVNKFLINSFHICATDEDKKLYGAQIRERYKNNTKLLGIQR